MAKIKCPKCGEEFEIGKDAYTELLSEIEQSEIEKRVSSQISQIESKYKVQMELETNKIKSNQDSLIADLRKQIDLLNQKEKQFDSNKELEILKVKNNAKEERTKLEQELLELKNKLESIDKDKELSEKNLKEKYEFMLKVKDEQIEKYKNFRLGDSTKDLGESLEQYCHDEFNKNRAIAYPHAYFEKDNDVDEEGKGDFIFRDFSEDGTEIVSIMFEMKNQKDTTKTKHKNEDFFSKLDKNRTSKGCEYAVLVTTLEEDSELYNVGIVDVSYRYPKMFVVRPQFFMAIIGLIRNMALNSLAYKRQVVAYQNENVDLMKFQQAVSAIGEKITKDYENADKQYEYLIDYCDKGIKSLEGIKESIRKVKGWLGAAQNQLPELEIKKLTKNNPGMKEKFDKLNDK